ncbi:hypothetical protein VMCG_09176 [Cytospora schulzeri]|uniref:Uncharacterized protein n=1 Tax=Cytospora schulzeri TaxID=448051 RepID=A0A423VLM4_9PEZI|nr:hypothetical protein VMCG_09176 [Valsa malicola]
MPAKANDMLNPDYTMGSLEVKGNGTAVGTFHHRVLRVFLTSCIADLYAPLSAIVSSALEKQISSGDRDRKGWTTLPSWIMTKSIITTFNNARVYFGAELMVNTQFHDSSVEDNYRTPDTGGIGTAASGKH